MKRIAFIFLFLALYETGYALDGIAAIGVHHPRFDCRRLVGDLKFGEEYALAVLYRSFGFERKCFDLLLADPDLKAVEIHIANEVCVRNKRCGRYELFYGQTINSLRRRLGKESRLLQKFRKEVIKAYEYYVPFLPERLRCFVSPSLESNVKTNAAKNMLKAVQDIWGDRCEVVWNPVRPTLLKWPIIECHYPQDCGDKACIASTDGVDRDSIPNSEYTAWKERHKSCELILDWRMWYNLIKLGPFIDPRSRSS